MKFFSFIILLFIILIAGCTTPTDTTDIPVVIKDYNGLAIINFTSNFYNLRVNELTNLKSLMKNYGDFEARDIISVLYGEGLLERTNEQNYSESILSDKEAIHFWGLKVPLRLSQTESTAYTLSSRLYYTYNFSGFQQVGFVSPDYSGGDVPLSGAVSKSPLTVNIQTKNPVRTLPQDGDQGTIFSVTTTITNQDDGNIDYFGCNALSTPPCRKGGHLKELRMSIPADWIQITDLSAWDNESDEENEIETYILNYDRLEAEYDYPQFDYDTTTTCDNNSAEDTQTCVDTCYELYENTIPVCNNEACVTVASQQLSNCLSRKTDGCLTSTTATETARSTCKSTYDSEITACATNSSCIAFAVQNYTDCLEDIGTLCGCYKYNGCASCRQKSGVEECNRVSEAINHLRLIRGEEARIVLQFAKLEVEETQIDDIMISGEFGYEVDINDFTSPVTLYIYGD